MNNYITIINPFDGKLIKTLDASLLKIKGTVANVASLPLTGNSENICYIVKDVDRLYTWNSTSSTGTIDKWVDIGSTLSVDWSTITNRPSSTVANIDDAVSKRHSNSLDHSNALDHTQGTDQGLDTGGTNAVTAAQAKAGYSHSQVAHAPSDAVSLATVKADTDIDDAIDNSHAPHSDDQVLPTALSQLSDDTTHRLVTDSEKSIWNDITDIALNVILNAFRIAQIGSLTIFSMIKGFMDEYVDQSGIDVINSTGETYNSAENFYSPESGEDVVLLLHANGDNGSQIILDDSPSNHSLTCVNGAELSTAEKKFGSASINLSGTTKTVTVPYSSDFEFFGAVHTVWTIDWWYKKNSFGGYWKCPFGQHLDAGNYLYAYDYGQYGLSIEVKKDGGLFLGMVSNANGQMNDNNWHHCMYFRNGNKYAIYVDGLQTGYQEQASTVIINSPLQIGNYPGNAQGINGYMDEIRIIRENPFGLNPNVGLTDTYGVPIIENILTVSNMILISENQIADTVPTSARIVIFEEDVDVIALNTDLKAYISRDNGNTFSQVTIEDEGSYITTAKVLSGVVNISSQPSGTDIVYKIESLNNKKLKIHGCAVSWK